MELYEKVVSPAGRVSYRLFTPPAVVELAEPVVLEPPCELPPDMTVRQIISAVAGLAVLAIHGYEQCLPWQEHEGRLIRKVKGAVLEMFKGTGAKIDNEIIDHVCSAWDGTMRRLSGEIKP